jgi:hypothetical protein
MNVREVGCEDGRFAKLLMIVSGGKFYSTGGFEISG